MHQRNRHDPLARDANLRRVQRATALTFAGGVVLSGGFYAAGAQAFSGTAHKVVPATVVGNVDDATGTQGSSVLAPPAQTSPSVVAPPQSTAQTPLVAQQAPTTIPPTTAMPTIAIAPPTQPVTLPHKKKHYIQPAPVVSGGS